MVPGEGGHGRIQALTGGKEGAPAEYGGPQTKRAGPT